MSVALDLGEGGVIGTNVARTDNYGRSCPYSNYCYDYNDYYYDFTKSASVTFMLTGLTPGQQVDVPVKFRANISSDNNTSYFSGYRYDKGGIDYTGNIATQLFID